MDTDMDSATLEALQRFQSKHGRYWKARLVELWASGKDERHQDGPALRRLRNTLGLDGLNGLPNPQLITR